MLRFATIGLAGVLVGCSGGDAEGCEEFLVEVVVTDPEGNAIPDVVVELDDTACVDSGDGITFSCSTTEPGEHNVYAQAVSYEPYGQRIDISSDHADCASPVVTQTVQLQRESAV